MKLLLLGATGLVGDRVLKHALAASIASTVIAPTRAPLSPGNGLLNPVMARLEDFVPALPTYAPDAVICALGTTLAKAGSRAAFRHVDYELPVAIGKAAYAAGVRTFAIVTAIGASAGSRFFYPRTKGEVERDLQQIGFRSLTICRPSIIGGERNESRGAEGAALMLARLLGPVLPRKFRVNPAESIAAALLQATVDAKPGCHWIYAEAMN